MKPAGFFLLFTSALVAGAQADDQWLWNAATGLFTSSTNWLDWPGQTLQGVPGPLDTALHWGHSSPYTVMSSADIETGSVHVSHGGTSADNVVYDFNGHTLLANGGTLHDRYGFEVVNPAGSGRLTLLDGVYQANALRVSVPTPSVASARMIIGAGASLTTGVLPSPLQDQVGGVGAVSQLTVQSGGTLDSVGLQVGSAAGEAGLVTLTGAGSLLQAVNPAAVEITEARAVAIGRQGNGEMQVSDGATLRPQSLSIGGDATVATPSGVGKLHVDNALLDFVDLLHHDTGLRTEISIGVGGQGELSLTNNATIDASSRFVVGGLASGGVGPGSSGMIEVLSGSDVTSREVRVGHDFGTSGSIVLDGPGTTWTDTNTTTIGFQGYGSLAITGGATMRLIEGDIGGSGIFYSARFAGSSADVLVSGPGTLLSVEATSFGIEAARQGTGSLEVRDGAVVQTSVQDIVIARSATAQGEGLVTGTGSVLRAGKVLSIGGRHDFTVATGANASGAGSLMVREGGSIEAKMLRVYADDTLTITAGGFGTIAAGGAVIPTPNTLSVAAGGTLSGQGQVVCDVHVYDEAVVDPRGVGSQGIWHFPGQLSIDGALTIDDGAAMRVLIERAGQAGVDYDALFVTGPVTLSGQLELTLGATYVPTGGDEFDLITGSDMLAGAFSEILNRQLLPDSNGEGPVIWGDYRVDDPQPGADRYFVAPRRQADFNGQGGVTGADYTIWADHFGAFPATFGEGDANGDRFVTGADFTLWADSFGNASFDASPSVSVPEPTASCLAGLAAATSWALFPPARLRQRKRPRLRGTAATIVIFSEGDGTRTRNHRIDSPVDLNHPNRSDFTGQIVRSTTKPPERD